MLLEPQIKFYFGQYLIASDKDRTFGDNKFDFDIPSNTETFNNSNQVVQIIEDQINSSLCLSNSHHIHESSLQNMGPSEPTK